MMSQHFLLYRELRQKKSDVAAFEKIVETLQSSSQVNTKGHSSPSSSSGSESLSDEEKSIGENSVMGSRGESAEAHSSIGGMQPNLSQFSTSHTSRTPIAHTTKNSRKAEESAVHGYDIVSEKKRKISLSGKETGRKRVKDKSPSNSHNGSLLGTNSSCARSENSNNKEHIPKVDYGKTHVDTGNLDLQSLWAIRGPRIEGDSFNLQKSYTLKVYQRRVGNGKTTCFSLPPDQLCCCLESMLYDCSDDIAG